MQFLDNTSKLGFEAGDPRPRSVESFAEIGTHEHDVGYVVEAGRGFDALKYAASLMTGTLLLDLTGSERSVQDQTLTRKAQDALAEAREHISAAMPHSDRAFHHKHHLLLALQYLTEAERLGDKSANLLRNQRSEAVFQAVRAALSELGKLDQLLSGFQTIDLSQSCCSYHKQQMARFSR